MNEARASAGAQKRTLRRLYLTLMFRGRRRGSGRPQRLVGPVVSFAMSLCLFAALGVLPALLGRVGFTTFAAALHAMTFLMVGINLATTSGSMLFNPEEAEVLLHRPVTPRALLQAKVEVIVAVSLALALALNACGLVVGALRADGTWLFIPAHLFSLTLEVLFCTSFVVLTYNLCLRWFGRERLENLMTAVQILVAVSAMLAGQIVPRLITRVDDATLAGASGWLAILPPAWFAALDTVLAGRGASPALLGLAALGIVATIGTTWIGVGRLAATYEQGLVTLNEAGPGAVKAGGRGRWVAGVLRWPLIRWWLRDPVERVAFRLTIAGLTRARGVKLRVYPMLAQFLVYPLIIFLGGSGMRSFDFHPFAVAFAGGFVAMLPPLVLDQLRPAEDWRASDLFWQAPLARASALFHGARKAVILALCGPGMGLVVALGAMWMPDRAELLLILPGLLVVPLFSMLPALGRPFVPFSQPLEGQTHNAGGCLLMMIFMTSAMGLAGLAGWAWITGWFAWMIAVEAGVVLVLAALVRRVIDAVPLRPQA